ncbi:MAG TPA: ArgE/DapE family deacylase [Opitutaceae bacterium]|nr:ArgE/DapE family deacylase [Opitutaceae bacterium]
MTPFRYLDRHRADLIGLLQRLVRIPTVNPPGANYAAITALLARELAAAGLRTRRLSAPIPFRLRREMHGRPRFNVVGFWDAGAPATVHFNAHYDVVPAGGRWRSGGPFVPAVAEGWIYGRGTADMKGSIASLVLALRALRATGVRPRCNVEVSFTADEETDSLLGAGWLVDRVPLKADYVVVMEGGEGPAIGCGHNGVVWLNVVVHGKPAHGSNPERGINALEKMSALVLALQDYQRRLARRRFRTPEGKMMHPTINVGGVLAGSPAGKINTVPAEASFSIDRRVIATETVGGAERELRSFLAAAARRIPRCRITVEKISENHPCFRDPAHPFFAAVAASVRRVRGGRPVFHVSTGFNDMHFFAERLHLPAAGYGPVGFRPHAVDERVRVRDLVTTAKIYADLLTTFAG